MERGSTQSAWFVYKALGEPHRAAEEGSEKIAALYPGFGISDFEEATEFEHSLAA